MKSGSRRQRLTTQSARTGAAAVHRAAVHRIVQRTTTVVAALSVTTLVAACSSSSTNNSYGVTASPRVVQFGQAVPSGGGNYKVGTPYRVAGRWYHPKEDLDYDEVGLASWYGSDFHGRRTANGEIFDMTSLSAAHPTLPLPTYARVTNLENGRSVVVRVNDRGPFAHNRLIDLSHRTADVLGFKGQGTAKVRVQYVGIAPLEGNDGQWLTTTVRNDGEPVGPVMLAGLTYPPPSLPTHETPSTYPQDPVYPQTTVAFTPTSYSPQAPAGAQPAFASPAAPVPQAPVGGGKVTYRWVSGYATSGGSAFVDAAFAMFDTERTVVLVIVQKDTGESVARNHR